MTTLNKQMIDIINDTVSYDDRIGTVFNTSNNEDRDEDNATQPTDILSIIKIARKCDFSRCKNEDTKLADALSALSFIDKGWLDNYLQKNKKFNYEYEDLCKISRDQLFSLISDHDSYWCVAFVRDAIGVIKDYFTSFRYVGGKCERFDPKDYFVRKKFISTFGLDLNIEEDNQLIRLVEDIQDESSVQSIEICCGEKDLKESILSQSDSILKADFAYDIEELMEYHIYHFMTRETARPILDAVSRLIKAGYLPSDLDLTSDDDWVGKIDAYLNDEIWDEEPINELEAKYDEEMFLDIKNEHINKVRNDAGKIGGKIGSPKKKVKLISTGQKFSSVSKLAESLGKSAGWISKQKGVLWKEA